MSLLLRVTLVELSPGLGAVEGASRQATYRATTHTDRATIPARRPGCAVARGSPESSTGSRRLRRSSQFWVHDDDVTLHGGFDISKKGWTEVGKGLTWAASRLTEGQVTFTPLGGRVVGDLAYVAGFEEGTARLEGGERRPMKLRVTMVFQRVDGQWLCVHRHGEMVRTP